MAPNDNYDLALRIGRLEGELAAVKQQNAELLSIVSELRDEFASAKGGVRTIMAVGSIGVVLGGAVAWAINLAVKLGHGG